jgi:Ca2+-binding RTX toxin-like protein
MIRGAVTQSHELPKWELVISKILEAKSEVHMATLHLTASGGNDTSSIQAAIDAAAAGDTIDFATGDYHVDGVTLKSGVTYHGQAGAVLNATGTNAVFSVDGNDSHNITIDALTFVGTGADPTSGVVDLSGTGAANSVDHIILSNSSFQNNGLTFDFIKNSQVIDDQFSNIHGVGTGIHGYHMDNSTIAGDIFTNDYQGVGLVFGGVANQGRNVVVANNVGTGMSRMGIEIIGSDPVYPGETTNLLVKGNYFTNWGTPSPDGETTAYSIVTDGGTGTQVVGNYAQGNHNSGVGVELAGVGAVASDNYLDGFSTGIIGYSSQDVIQNNNIINYSSAATSTYTQTDEIVQNNTSDPSLAHPSMPGGWGSTSTPVPTSSPAPPPTPAPAPDPSAQAQPTPQIPDPSGQAQPTPQIPDPSGQAQPTPQISRDLIYPDHTGTATGSSSQADVLTATGAHQTLIGNAGNDVFQLGSHGDATVGENGHGISTVTTSAASYTLPTGIDDLTATGTGNHVLTGNAGNNYITGSNGSDAINGGTGNDTIVVGTGTNVLSGGGGHDTFVFPKAADHGNVVTDFTAGTDVLDLRGALTSANYHGTDPVADHVLNVAADGHGGTSISIDPDGTGPGAGHVVVTLQQVLPGALHANTDYIWH